MNDKRNGKEEERKKGKYKTPWTKIENMNKTCIRERVFKNRKKET